MPPSHDRHNFKTPASNRSNSDGDHKKIKQRRMHLLRQNINPRLFPVFTLLRMIECSRRINTSDHCLMLVYVISNIALCFLNSKHVAAYLQSMAKTSHGITIKEELKKWTSHSIRVVSWVLLSEGSHDGLFIKIHLH